VRWSAKMSKKRLAVIEGIISLLIFGLIWKIASATGIFGRVSVKSSQLLLPPPEKVLYSIYSMLASGYLEKHIWVSFWRVIRGFAIAVAIGVPVGILMGINTHAKNFLNIVFRLFSPIPGVAWVPLAILWFGLGDKAALFIITMGSISPIIINTMQGVDDVDNNLEQALLTMGATKLQLVTRCIIPSIVPYMVSGFRLGLGFAWRVVIAAELVGVPDGLGYVLNTGRSTGKTEVTVVTIFLLGVIMILMEEVLFRPIELKVCHWRKAGRE
jgi:ABC-type nitrate/sulfonate/bicarbonate transport system permease component